MASFVADVSEKSTSIFKVGDEGKRCDENTHENLLTN
jgi:hypothetical protein